MKEYFFSNMKTTIIIPLYNGFGSEDDSLGNCLRVTNQSSKKNTTVYILIIKKTTLGTDG